MSSRKQLGRQSKNEKNKLSNYKKDKYYPKVVSVVDEILKKSIFVAPVEVFIRIGNLSRKDYENWRFGRAPRDWIFETSKNKIPSGTRIWRRFNEFYSNLSISAKTLDREDKEIEEMPVTEFIVLIKHWIKSNPS